MGWTSATIARIGYPPPKPLTAAGEKRLRNASTVLVALGLASAQADDHARCQGPRRAGGGPAPARLHERDHRLIAERFAALHTHALL